MGDESLRAALEQIVEGTLAGEHAADLAFEAGQAGAFLQRGGGEVFLVLRGAGQHGGEPFALAAAAAGEEAHDDPFRREDAGRGVLRERVRERRELRRVEIEQRHRRRQSCGEQAGSHAAVPAAEQHRPEEDEE